MYKLLTPAFLLAICIICMGCPFGSPYALEPEPKERVKEDLLGKWEKSENDTTLLYTIELSRKTDFEYWIRIKGDLTELIPTWSHTDDSIMLSGFTSTVDGYKFLNIFSQGVYYLVHLNQTGPYLSLMPLSDRFSNKLIKNNQWIKEFVSDHMKTQTPLYDKQTSVRGLIKAKEGS